MGSIAEITDEGRISEFKDKKKEITQFEQEIKWLKNKMNRASGAFKTILKDLTCTSNESENEIKKECGAKKCM